MKLLGGALLFLVLPMVIASLILVPFAVFILVARFFEKRRLQKALKEIDFSDQF